MDLHALVSFLTHFVKRLQAQKCGIASSGWVPQAWLMHIWTGKGTPASHLVEDLLTRLRSNAPLPHVSFLCHDADLEASAARALDLFDEANMIPVLLHADDPIFLASSKGEADRVMNIVYEWAVDFKATLHVGPEKTVVQAGGCQLLVSGLRLSAPLKFRQPQPHFPIPLTWRNNHKWPGLQWHADGNFDHHAATILAACSTLVSFLCGLVTNDRIPVGIARHLFNIKVEAKIRFGRWLWASTTHVLEKLDACYDRWAKLILGADPWRNEKMCSSELGWDLTGAARAVHDMATKRAYFWQQADKSLAGQVFVNSHLSEGDTWAKRTHTILSDWGVSDWPMWVSTCLEQCTPFIAQHVRPIPYIQLTRGPTTMFNDALRLRVPWSVLVGHRSLSRLRCGLISLGHVNHRTTSAAVQQCLFCMKRYSSVCLHVVCHCVHFNEQRAPLQQAGVDCSNLNFLCSLPEQTGFNEIVGLAACIDKMASLFWKAGPV